MEIWEAVPQDAASQISADPRRGKEGWGPGRKGTPTPPPEPIEAKSFHDVNPARPECRGWQGRPLAGAKNAPLPLQHPQALGGDEGLSPLLLFPEAVNMPRVEAFMLSPQVAQTGGGGEGGRCAVP